MKLTHPRLLLSAAPFASIACLGSARLAQNSKGVSWVATWGASPVDMGNHNYTGTIRNIVFTAVSGDTVRVRLTNTFGGQPLQIDDAHIGVSEPDGSIAGPNVPLTFSGASSITIPQGAEVLSDPISLSVPALSDLAVSMFIPQATEQTGHFDSQTTTFITFGTDQAGDPITAGFVPITSWWFVDSVDVLAQEPVQGAWSLSAIRSPTASSPPSTRTSAGPTTWRVALKPARALPSARSTKAVNKKREPDYQLSVGGRQRKKVMKEMVWNTIGNSRGLGNFAFVCLALVIWVVGRACLSIFQDAILQPLFE